MGVGVPVWWEGRRLSFLGRGKPEWQPVAFDGAGRTFSPTAQLLIVIGRLLARLAARTGPGTHGGQDFAILVPKTGHRSAGVREGVAAQTGPGSIFEPKSPAWPQFLCRWMGFGVGWGGWWGTRWGRGGEQDAVGAGVPPAHVGTSLGHDNRQPRVVCHMPSVVLQCASGDGMWGGAGVGCISMHFGCRKSLKCH